MKKEEILKIIETRIEDLDVLIKLGGKHYPENRSGNVAVRKK